MFCRNATTFRDCDNDILLHSKIDLHSECMSKLPLTNYVMQTDFNLYFSLIIPININITCSNKTEKIYLKQSSNILGIFNCSLNAENLLIHTNKSTEYKIQALSKPKRNDKYILLQYFHLCLLCFFLIPSLLLITFQMLKYKELPEETNTNTYASLNNNNNFDNIPTRYIESLI